VERKAYVRNLIIGALGGAAMGVLLALAYQRWGGQLSIRHRTERTRLTLRRPVSIKQTAQIGMLGFQLLREMAHLLQPVESA